MLTLSDERESCHTRDLRAHQEPGEISAPAPKCPIQSSSASTCRPPSSPRPPPAFFISTHHRNRRLFRLNLSPRLDLCLGLRRRRGRRVAQSLLYAQCPLLALALVIPLSRSVLHICRSRHALKPRLGSYGVRERVRLPARFASDRGCGECRCRCRSGWCGGEGEGEMRSGECCGAGGGGNRIEKRGREETGEGARGAGDRHGVRRCGDMWERGEGARGWREDDKGESRASDSANSDR